MDSSFDLPIQLTLVLVHFLWQGAAIAVLGKLVASRIPDSDPQSRYLVYTTSMVLMVLCVPATWMWFEAQKSPLTVTASIVRPEIELSPDARADADRLAFPISDSGSDLDVAGERRDELLSRFASSNAAIDRSGTDSANGAKWFSSQWVIDTVRRADHGWISHGTRSIAPYASAAYLAGVLFMVFRLAFAIEGARRWRRDSIAISDARLAKTLSDLSKRMNLRSLPALLCCDRSCVPVVVGIMRPVILLPSALICGLSPDQLEAVLTHELAHIKRLDLVVAFFQRLVETFLFFHPAVWFVSRRISYEREAACDDTVVASGWERLHYAQALVRLAELVEPLIRPQAESIVVAATGGRPSELKRRVLRLIGPPKVQEQFGTWASVAAASLLFTVAMVAFRELSPSSPPTAFAQDASARIVLTPNVVGQSSPPGENDWSQWGGGPTRNNVAVAKNLPTTFGVNDVRQLRWSTELGTSTFASPIVANGKVLIGTNNGSQRDATIPKAEDRSCLLCFDEASGAFQWQYAVPKRDDGRKTDWPLIGLCASPLVIGDRVWIVTNRAEIVCLDLNGFRDEQNDGPFLEEPRREIGDADIIWKFDMYESLGVRPVHQSCCSLTSDGDLLFLNSGQGSPTKKGAEPVGPSFLAVDRHSGHVVWMSNLSQVGLLSWECPCAPVTIAVFGGVKQAIFPAGDGWLYSFDVAEIQQGRSILLWKCDCNRKNARSMLGNGGTRNGLVGAAVAHGERLYVATGQNPEHGEGVGRLLCLDPTRRGDVSEELVFNRADPTTPLSPKLPMACDEAAGDFAKPNLKSAVLWAFESFDENGDGKLQFGESMHRTIGSPVVSSGRVYVGDLSGVLHCLDAESGKSLWYDDLFAACWSTPLVADGKVFVADEDGEVAVYRDAPTKELLGTSSLGAPIYGTMCSVGDSMFVASKLKLFCWGGQTNKERQAKTTEHNKGK